MITFGNKKVVWCDVDMTLVEWPLKEEQKNNPDLIAIDCKNYEFKMAPHKNHIEFLKQLKAQGYVVNVHSAGGGEWAERIVKLLKLEDFVDCVMSKPEFVIDDLKKCSQIINKIIYIDSITGDFQRSFE